MREDEPLSARRDHLLDGCQHLHVPAGGARRHVGHHHRALLRYRPRRLRRAALVRQRHHALLLPAEAAGLALRHAHLPLRGHCGGQGQQEGPRPQPLDHALRAGLEGCGDLPARPAVQRHQGLGGQAPARGEEALDLLEAHGHDVAWGGLPRRRLPVDGHRDGGLGGRGWRRGRKAEAHQRDLRPHLQLPAALWRDDILLHAGAGSAYGRSGPGGHDALRFRGQERLGLQARHVDAQALPGARARGEGKDGEDAGEEGGDHGFRDGAQPNGLDDLRPLWRRGPWALGPSPGCSGSRPRRGLVRRLERKQ
mmetsp:Transcript_101298/g.295025  ORF Transcript_101298/g.295025 Transcript_101298/m.295025 type:complete len:309 (-) Transcript_101298:74-1000(-)